MRRIEPLTLMQDRTQADGTGTSTGRWYGWSTQGGITWGPSPSSPAGRPPDYACDVITPQLLAGSPDEIRADVGWHLRRHAERLNLD